MDRALALRRLNCDATDLDQVRRDINTLTKSFGAWLAVARWSRRDPDCHAQRPPDA